MKQGCWICEATCWGNIWAQLKGRIYEHLSTNHRVTSSELSSTKIALTAKFNFHEILHSSWCSKTLPHKTCNLHLGLWIIKCSSSSGWLDGWCSNVFPQISKSRLKGGETAHLELKSDLIGLLNSPPIGQLRMSFN